MYEILPHTADLRLKITGQSLEELFALALLGMNNTLKPGFGESSKDFPVNDTLVVKAPDLTSLLVDFLSEALTKSYEQQTVFCQAKFGGLTENSAEALLYGAKVDGFDRDIKAVTYHEANVVRNQKGEWETIIVFDI